MNFSPFGTHFPGIHQFVSNASTQDSTNRYNTVNANTNHFNQSQILKFRNDEVTTTSNVKYSNSHHAVSTTQYGTVSYSAQPANETKEQKMVATSTATTGYQGLTAQSKDTISQIQHSDLTQDLTALLQQTETKRVLQNVNTSWQSLTTPASSVADYLSHLPASSLPLSLHHFLKYSAENIKKEAQNPLSSIDMGQAQTTTQTINLNNLTSSLLPSTTSIANIISQQQQQTIQNNQQQIGNNANLSTNTLQPQANQGNIQTQNQIQNTSNNNSNNIVSGGNVASNNAATTTTTTKKKKKKKSTKERKPRPKPGEIRLTTALDGSTLYMCPDCQICYPERGILEQHMIGHNLDRKFICDICNAALKRKDHLTRHKQSHNPERPFICTVCLKAFKRKEQLTLHIVIHSGEKRHVCQECNKGFYRKDHLRKHTRSHIARRVKAELSAQQPQTTSNAQQQTGNNVSAHQTQPQQNVTTPNTQNTHNNYANNSNNNNNNNNNNQQQQQQSSIETQLHQQIQQAHQLHAQLAQQISVQSGQHTGAGGNQLQSQMIGH